MHIVYLKYMSKQTISYWPQIYYVNVNRFVIIMQLHNTHDAVNDLEADA